MEKIKELFENKKELKFNNGKFKIMMMSDLHGGVDCSPQISVAIEAMVESEKPDFVFFCGDTAGPGKIHVENEKELRAMLDDFMTPMEKRNIPWAHVFGNHDDNHGIGNEEQIEIYRSYPSCLSKRGDKNIHGVGNYIIPVMGENGEPELILYFLDSKNRRIYLHYDQVMWYINSSEAIEKAYGRKIPSLMFMHIPMPELQIIDDNREECKTIGTAAHHEPLPRISSGLFNACVQRGDVKGIFFGHDHYSDFVGELNGIRMGYDASMDYNAGQSDEMRGVRIFEIDEKDAANFTTYMKRVKEVMGEKGNKKNYYSEIHGMWF